MIADERPPFEVEIRRRPRARALRTAPRAPCASSQSTYRCAVRCARRTCSSNSTARLESVAIALERPGDAFAHSSPHRVVVGAARTRKLAVKILEREMKGGAVGGGGRTVVFDRRARVAVKPLARALGVRVECRRAEVLVATPHAGGSLSRGSRFGELELRRPFVGAPPATAPCRAAASDSSNVSAIPAL